ncbi:MAG: UDP-N-acetylmuramoyl-tripeptide--D-alanyl-D-alanine ligase [Mobilicoccus sp.]|nr:UDP-N-acetylmuramoyl-tripeptide--D-alanyl-D-alanine ligase [Mobilicoccus sp.]
MIPLTLRDIAEITGGRLSGDPDIRIDGPVVTDSREAAPGSLYVARIGEHADGHSFIPAAHEGGARASLVTRDVETPAVVVEDVQAAFAALASEVVRRRVAAGMSVVGITGSSGKTTTKDLLAAVLEQHAPTVANVGSLNSEVGVPLTVCRVTEQTEILVLEMGARGLGHIDYLTGMAPPQVGVVLNVGSAHLGEFGSRETIGRAKSELVAALPEGGLAVLNADDDIVRGMVERTRARVCLVGRAADAEIRAENVILDARGAPSFDLLLDGQRRRVSLTLLGEHQVDNALAVVAVARHIGMSLDAVTAALESARPGSRWRMERHDRPDGVVIVNDAYNANPDSMSAALRTIARIERRGRAVAVLGAMYELGADSVAEHRRMGALAAELGYDTLVAVGLDAGAIADGTADHPGSDVEVYRADTVDHAATFLENYLDPGDVVLLKSSRDAGLRLLGDALTQEART